MGISDELGEMLEPLRTAKLQLFIPLFVDTFPLGYFYASSGDLSTSAASLVHLVHWNDFTPLRSVLRETQARDQPLAIYVSRDRGQILERAVASLKQLRDRLDVQRFAVSTLRMRKFFAKPSVVSGFVQPRIASFEEWLDNCRGVDLIIIHSDQDNLATRGQQYVSDLLDSRSREWGSRPRVIAKRSDLFLSLFCPQYSTRVRQLYWLSGLGLAALRKTAGDFPDFDVPDTSSANLPGDDTSLEIALLFPHRMSVAERGRIVAAINGFHQRLFAFSESELDMAFEHAWETFANVMVMRWPVFNVFKNVGEYTRCFTDHYVGATPD